MGHLTLPAGSMIVGHAVDGRFRLDVVPSVHIDTLLPGADCDDDVPGGTVYPLTANLLYPVVSNTASLGECTGTPDMMGPVNYFQFRVGGDVGGALVLQGDTDQDTFVVQCSQVPRAFPAAHAATGLGAQHTFYDLVELQNSECDFAGHGRVPSDWGWHTGYVYNWNAVLGDVYAGVGSMLLHTTAI